MSHSATQATPFALECNGLCRDAHLWEVARIYRFYCSTEGLRLKVSARACNLQLPRFNHRLRVRKEKLLTVSLFFVVSGVGVRGQTADAVKVLQIDTFDTKKATQL